MGDILSVNISYNARLNQDGFKAKVTQALIFLEQEIPGLVNGTLIDKVLDEAAGGRDADVIITVRLSNHGQERTVLTVARETIEKEAVFEV